jgi:hypothetical protein
MSESSSTQFVMKDKAGNNVEVPFNVSEYQAAENNGLTLTQHLTQKYGEGTDEGKYGSVIGQFMASAGMFMGEDNVTGLKSPTMHAVATGGIKVGAITRNDGSNSNSPSGRLLFPEILMRTIESELRESRDDFLNGWESMIAQTASISGPKFDQPIIDVTAPEASESNPISQLAPPDAMVSITVSDISRNIPTKSIGLMISDQAQQASTLDLVSLAMTAQARGERIRMIEGHLSDIINGSVDNGGSALSSVTAQSFDALVVAAGNITHKAYIKYLRTEYQKRSLNRIICDIDTALALEARAGKPTRDTVLDQSNTSFPTGMSVDNLMVNSPSILLMDTAVVGANTVIGLDSRFAIRRVINVNAQYSAIENFLMRRATGFRIDYGEVAHRLYDDAFSKMTLTV